MDANFTPSTIAGAPIWVAGKASANALQVGWQRVSSKQGKGAEWQKPDYEETAIAECCRHICVDESGVYAFNACDARIVQRPSQPHVSSQASGTTDLTPEPRKPTGRQRSALLTYRLSVSSGKARDLAKSKVSISLWDLPRHRLIGGWAKEILFSVQVLQ